MKDLIITANGNTVNEEILNQTEAYNVSDRYKVINTRSVIDFIKEIEPEAEITGYAQSNPRIIDKKNKQRHAIMISLPDAAVAKGTDMNIVLYNSYDRSSAMKLYIGAIRMVCSNQMVAGSQLVDPVSLRHTKNQDWTHSVRTLMEEYEQHQEQMKDMFKRMTMQYTSYSDMMRYAEVIATEIINPNITGEVLDIGDVVRVERSEDVGKNVFLQFQKAQEHVLQGGVRRVIEKDIDGKNVLTITKTHKVTDQRKVIELNRTLMDTTMDFFRIAA